MATPQQLEQALHKVGDQPSFIQSLLIEGLGWEIDNRTCDFDEISYDWSADDLRDAGLDKHVVAGRIRQLQPLVANQPWGIFLLEFKNPDAFTAGRGMAGPLRKVLRGLVANRRNRPTHLPFWDLENILFICTSEYKHYTFAHFRDIEQKGNVSRARLSTFGWSPDSPARTVAEYNLPALVYPDDPTDRSAWIKQWSTAFDKEVLTKKFFSEFRDRFHEVAEEIRVRNRFSVEKANEKAQILLSRLLFLYFLQKKGWLNREPAYFARHVEAHCDYDAKATSLFDEVLEPLFRALGQREANRKEVIRVGLVPYMDGGLFDEDSDSGHPLRISNGVLRSVFRDFLERYNFTVREDTPLNQDIAIDPEMLGKVFECLVLEMESADDADQAPDRRKATASYYTPRIVVHFICREVLRQHLLSRLPSDGWRERLDALLDMDIEDGFNLDEMKTLQQNLTADQARQLLAVLRDLKTCDPAVGSGAFAVGLLHSLVTLAILCEVSIESNRSLAENDERLFHWKKHFIENAIYGVDIQSRAVEICQLRLWLSLVVDYRRTTDVVGMSDAEFRREMDEFPPLPNLDFKIVRGDSLLDIVHGRPFVLGHVDYSADARVALSELIDLQHRYFGEPNAISRRAIRRRALEARCRLARALLELQAQEGELRQQEDLFGGSERDAAVRRRIEAEQKRIRDALKEVETIEKELAQLRGKRSLGPDDEETLRRLEIGDPYRTDRITFSWRLAFPEVFDTERGRGGFDIVVGNPPFVTARNREKRELYRERWRQVCYKEYQLLVPFFARSFGLLGKAGHLGFIVSNAFSKREFGIPLVEHFFPTVDVQKVVDCSGLMFPGHGTPTCIVFGRGQKPNPESTIRVAAIIPGGGDLRTSPEESPLWHTLATEHDNPGYSDGRIIIADHSRSEMGKWPWRFEPEGSRTESLLQSEADLSFYCSEPVGAQFITGRDDVYVSEVDFPRRVGVPRNVLRFYSNGEDVRDWSFFPPCVAVFPYADDLCPLEEPLPGGMLRVLHPFRGSLENAIVSGSTRKCETALKWFEYRRLARAKFGTPLNIILPQIATHAHFVVTDHNTIFKEKAQAIALKDEIHQDHYHLLAGLLNSSSVLFWLKQVCFSKREAEEAESGTYFEFAGGKVEQTPLPRSVVETFEGKRNPLSERILNLSQSCWERGQVLPSLHVRNLFEKRGEAYSDWNCSLPGYVAPHRLIAKPFESADELRERFHAAVSERERLRSEMIALQEEMDWIVYRAYDLLDSDAALAKGTDLPPPLALGQRPFELWKQAGENFEAACGLIPRDFASERRALWKERFALIRDNEHIRRIEQPVYKRRWYMPDSYEKQLREAFEWWLLEKAEWWLENKKAGGPAALDEWAAALWRDGRIRAAVEVVESKSASADAFARLFKRIVNSATVAEGIPFAVAWDDLEKQIQKNPPEWAKKDKRGLWAVPNSVRALRGKLNVPRERFHLRARDLYLWAGLLWR